VGGETRFGVETLETAELGAVESVVIVISCQLPERELPCPAAARIAAGRAAARAGTYDANVAGKFISAIRTITWSGRDEAVWARGAGRDSSRFSQTCCGRHSSRAACGGESQPLFEGLEMRSRRLPTPLVCHEKEDANAILLGKDWRNDFRRPTVKKLVEARIPKVTRS